MSNLDARFKPGDAPVRWQIDGVIKGLRGARERWREARKRYKDAGVREFPSTEALKRIVEDLCGVLFPMRLGPLDLRQESEDLYIAYTLDRTLNLLLQQVQLELGIGGGSDRLTPEGLREKAIGIVNAFVRELPAIRVVVDSDVEAAFAGDPAAKSMDEILLCYPGIRAIILHRLAHRLYQLEVKLLARIIAEIAHSETGIDIHPGAQIGGSFFIDHGTGVVIGESAVIGERVRIYQAVTLGAKRFFKDEKGALQKGLARHPIVEDDVVIYAGATILGRVTIGKGSSIGGNVWLTRDVTPGSFITQANLRQEAVSVVGA